MWFGRFENMEACGYSCGDPSSYRTSIVSWPGFWKLVFVWSGHVLFLLQRLICDAFPRSICIDYYSGNESSKFDACSFLILGTQSSVWSRCGQGSTENLDKVKGVIEGQPCRLPQAEGMTRVDSLSFAPETCLGEQSNVPLKVLGSSSNESECSLGISVPHVPFIGIQLSHDWHNWMH